MINLTRKLAVATLLAGAMVMTEADAAGYLKIGDIKGESTDRGHEDEIDILDISWSVSSPNRGATGASRRRGGAIVSDIQVTKAMDAASPKLFEACATGQVMREVVLTMAKDSGDRPLDYLVITLTNVRVTDVSTSVSETGESSETISLNYAEIKVSYAEQARDGSKKGNVEVTWQVEKGQR